MFAKSQTHASKDDDDMIPDRVTPFTPLMVSGNRSDFAPCKEDCISL
jgi:hypothetical protein